MATAPRVVSSTSRGRAGPLPASPSNYYIVQVFVAFGEQPQIPLILRVDENCQVSSVLEQALTKYSEALNSLNDPLTAAAYGPPSTSLDDYILRVALGDGTPDTSAPPLDKAGVMREQGLLFPYMVVLTLDPSRDPSEMRLTQHYKEASVRRAGRPGSADPLSNALSSLNLGGVLSPQQLFREKAAVEAFQEQQLQKQRLEGLRDLQISRIERDQQEKERLHLEECEKKERERRRNLVEQRRAEEARQFLVMEEEHKKDMERKMEEFLKEQARKEAIEKHQKQLEKEERERLRRHQALERERQRRQAEKERLKEEEEAERLQEWQQGREYRLERTLGNVINDLEMEIQRDTRARLEMLERERQEREAQERLEFEQQYIAKVERQRKLQKDRENMERLAKEERRRAEILEKERREAETKRKEAEEEAVRFEAWKAKRRLQLEKSYREQELDMLNTIAAEVNPRRQIAADSL